MSDTKALLNGLFGIFVIVPILIVIAVAIIVFCVGAGVELANLMLSVAGIDFVFR